MAYKLERSADPPLSGRLAIWAQDFAHPCEVVSDCALTAGEKRAILAAWASDRCAVESRPAFRWLPGTPGPVAFSHILRALAALDGKAQNRPACDFLRSPAMLETRPGRPVPTTACT